MSKRLDNLFKLSGKLSELREEMIELGMLTEAKAFADYNNQFYNACLEVENAESELGSM